MLSGKNRLLSTQEILYTVNEILALNSDRLKTIEFIHHLYGEVTIENARKILKEAEHEWAIAQGYHRQLENKVFGQEIGGNNASIS